MTGAPSSAMRVEPFTRDHVSAVQAFNRRLAVGGVDWRFPEDPVPTWLARTEHSPVFQEYLLLTDGEHVRGAYALKHQDASVRGELLRVGCSYWMLSEGTINKAYALVASRLLQDAVRREPLLFAVGMEGGDTPIVRLLRASGWRLTGVPFSFKVINGTRFLREIRYLRSTRLRRWVFDLAAITGAGWVGARLSSFLLTRRLRRSGPAAVEIVDEFGPWADELWGACRGRYSFHGVRDSAALNQVFPPGKPGLVRLKVMTEGRVVGFAVLRDARDPGHEHFGGMRVGTIADCLACPEHADQVIRASTAVLEQRGADLVISNQSHPAWGRALRGAGFLSGPSTFMFATSGPLTDLLARADPGMRDIHVNRGDGDYPWGSTLRVRAGAGGDV
jgi:hypothetical protein